VAGRAIDNAAGFTPHPNFTTPGGPERLAPAQSRTNASSDPVAVRGRQPPEWLEFW
jgi:hypothetical protein